MFWVVSRERGSKNSPKWQKLCLLHFISLEPYIIWSSLVVHKCKMIISPGFFFFFSFSKFWVFRLSGWSNCKKWPIMTYLSKHISFYRILCCTSLKWWHLQMLFSLFQNLSHSVSQELYLIWLWFLVHMCKIMIYPTILFQFFKILIFRFFQSSSINAKRKFWGVSNLLQTCVIFIQTFQKFDMQYHVACQLAR